MRFLNWLATFSLGALVGEMILIALIHHDAVCLANICIWTFPDYVQYVK